MNSPRRKYTLHKRAEHMAATRRRIMEAVVRLHEELGPARTTVTDIARLAGVQRLTVYTHFPDDLALLSACAAHWRAAHPAPDPEGWRRIEDPAVRLRAALGAQYGHYRTNARMLGHLLRDARLSEAVAAVVDRGYRRALRDVAELLRPGWTNGDLLLPAVLLALDFETWQALALGQGLDDARVVELMVRFVRAAAGGG